MDSKWVIIGAGFVGFLVIAGAAFFLLSRNIIKLPPTQKAAPTPTNMPTPTPLPSATPTPSASPSAAVKAEKAVIRTNKGNIELTLFEEEAPKTVANFVQKAKSGFYKNLIFHRVEDWVVQGGDPDGDGTGGGDMPTELNKKPFVVGSLGVARRDDIRISNDAQFFITKTDASWLNEKYTNFGIVTKGIEVVNKIEVGDKILGITID